MMADGEAGAQIYAAGATKDQAGILFRDAVIRGLSDVAGGNSFASLMGQFNAANSGARSGDMDAAKSLPQLSQALLAAAADAATSRQELARVQAATAAQLEATYGVVGALTAAKPKSTTAQATAVAESQGGSTGSAFNDDTASAVRELKEENTAMRRDLTAALATIASNTGRVVKKLEDVTPNGDAIAVETA